MAERVEVEILATDKTAGTLSNISKSFTSMGKKLTAYVTLPFLGAAGAALKAAADYEQSQIAFTTMLGSAEEAKSLLQDISQFAATTPFQLPEVEAGAKQLLAMGSETGNLVDELRMLGDVSAGLNVPMERMILNFGQVRLQGKLTGRELRDFSVAGVPLIDELAKTLGVAKEEIADMVTKGEVSFDDVLAAFRSMTSEGGRFNNLMQAQSQTTAGQWSNLKDTITLLAREIGQQLLPMANQFLAWAQQAVAWFTALDPGTRNLIFLFAGLAAVVGPLLILAGALIGALGTISTALAGVGLSLSGILLPVLAVIAVGAALYLAWQNNFLGIRDLVAKVWSAMKPVFDTIKKVLDTVIPIALSVLSQYWNGVLLPALQRVWQFLQQHVFPLFQSIGNFLGSAFSLVITALSGLWQKVLLPAMTKVWEFVDRYLMPVIKGLAAYFMDKMEPAIRAIGRAFDWVRGLIDKLANGLDWLKGHLPDWLTPGSPTPLELGLKGIGSELNKLSRTALPKFSMGIDQTPLPAFAGQGSQLAAAAAGGAGGSSQIVVQFAYQPTFSFADANEAEYKIAPMIEKTVRKVIEEKRL